MPDHFWSELHWEAKAIFRRGFVAELCCGQLLNHVSDREVNGQRVASVTQAESRGLKSGSKRLPPNF
jgi:hypothetical protein